MKGKGKFIFCFGEKYVEVYVYFSLVNKGELQLEWISVDFFFLEYSDLS